MTWADGFWNVFSCR